MWHTLSSRTAILAGAAVLLVVCCVLPVAYLLVTTLQAGDDAGAALWLDARQRDLLRTTAALGAGSALLATLVGAPLGLVLARMRLRHTALLRLALTAPILLPPYVAGLAWVHLAGSRGLIASAAGHDVLAGWTYSLPAAILVLGAVLYPLSMLATEVALRRVDGRLEEAGVLVAPPGRVLGRITLPLIAPGVLAAALIVFVLAVSDFGVPGLLRVRVFTTEVFTAFAALYDFRRAVLVAMPLLVLCLTVAVAASALIGDTVVVARRAAGVPPIMLDHWRRHGVVLAILVFAGALLVPLAVLAREAAAVRSPAAVLAGSGGAIANSLVLAALGATAVVSVAVWLGYARSRAGRRAGFFADTLFIALFAVPSTIVGVGLIGVWNRAGPFGAVYGTDGMFLLGYLGRFLPVAALFLAAVARQVPASHEEAAAVSGAGWMRTAFGVVLPQMRPALLAVWVIAFVLAFGELGVSVLIAPPGVSTLPIWIYTMIANTPPSHVALLALLQAAVIFVPLAVLGIALARRRAG